MKDVTSTKSNWDSLLLGKKWGAKEVITRFSNVIPAKAVIVFGVDYKYFGVHFRNLFKFEGIHMDNWRWSKQPIDPTEKDHLNTIVDTGLAHHLQNIERTSRGTN